MAVQDDTVVTGSSPQPQQHPADGGWTLGGVGLLDAPIPRGVGSEYLGLIKEGLTTIYKSSRPEVEVAVLELNRAADASLNFSSLLICTRLRQNANLGVAFHVLLLSETGEEIPPVPQQIFDRTINIYRFPADAINKILKDKAESVVARHFNVPRTQVFFVDGTVIPKAFDPKNPQHMQAVALNSAMAGYTEMVRKKPNFTDINLATLQKQGQTSVELDFGRRQLLNDVGSPFRSDLTIALVDRKSGNERDLELNKGDRMVRVCELSSFVDAVYYPGQEYGGFSGAFAPQNAAPPKKFVAREVITAIRSNIAVTPAATLLAISTSLCLRDPKFWIQALLPSHNERDKIDIFDVGAFNFEGNLPVRQPNGIISPDPSGFGKAIDTKDDAFGAVELGGFIGSLFHDNFMIAIDVPEMGPETFYLSVFSAAAFGSSEAQTQIIKAANELTGGMFSKHFQSNDIFATRPERIHAGFWVDNRGQTRDIRDFDYLAAANILGPQQPQLIREWTDTFLRLEYPEAQRLDSRRRMIRSFSNETARFTGHYQRLTFSGGFMDALNKSISQHLNVGIRTAQSGNEYISQRGTASWAPAAFIGKNTGYINPLGVQQGNAAPMGYGQNLRF